MMHMQTESITPGEGGGGLIPSSHKRSEHKHKIILHPDSLREKAI